MRQSLGQAAEVVGEFFVADLSDVGFVVRGEFFPDGSVNLDDAEGFGVMEHLHVFEAFEGVGEDVALGLSVGVAAFGVEAVGFFDDEAGGSASLVESTEIVDDVAEFDAAFVVGAGENGFEEHGLVGVAHVHFPHHVQEKVFAVGVVNEGPAVLPGVFSKGVFFEIVEGAVRAHGHNQVGHELPFPQVALDGLGLHVHPANKFHLGDHAGGFFLPIEEVDEFIIQRIHRPVDEGVGPFAAGVEPFLGGFLPFWSHNEGAGLVVFQAKETVHGIGHVVLAGVVDEVEHHEAFFPRRQAHAAAQLLGIEHFGHGRPRHEEHLGGRAVPAFVEQVAGAQHFKAARFEPRQQLAALAGFACPRHRRCGNTRLMEPFGNLLGMLDGGAENDGAFVADIAQPGVNDELVALGHINLALQVANVVLNAVEPHLGQVDVGVNANAAHRHQLANLDGGLNVELVGGVFENVENVGVVGALRRGGQAQGEGRGEIGEHLLVGVCGSMMGLVDDDVAKVVRPKMLQIQGHALNAAADNEGIVLFCALNIAAHRHLGPKGAEGLCSLIHQLHRVRQKEGALAQTLGVQHGGHRLASAGGVVKQGDGLGVVAHRRQSRQCLLLVRLECQLGAIQRLSALSGQVILDGAKARAPPQEHAQLVLDRLRLLLHLPHGPAVHVPAQMDHAVLLEQVVIELILRHQLGIVARLVVNFYGHLPPAVFNQKISKAAVLINVRKRVLGIQIASLLRPKRVGKQLDEQILGAAARGRTVCGHGGHLQFFHAPLPALKRHRLFAWYYLFIIPPLRHRFHSPQRKTSRRGGGMRGGWVMGCRVCMGCSLG